MKTNSKFDAGSLEIISLLAGACTVVCAVFFFVTSLTA